MPEISQVRMMVPDQGTLSRILREGGAQQFPQWLYAEPGDEARIVSWGDHRSPWQRSRTCGRLLLASASGSHDPAVS